VQRARLCSKPVAMANPRDYLEDVLSRLPAMKAAEVASLTPANWLKARQLATRRAA